MDDVIEAVIEAVRGAILTPQECKMLLDRRQLDRADNSAWSDVERDARLFLRGKA